MNLEVEYEKVAKRAIKQKLITRKEWDTDFKFLRDEWGHSFVHYLEAIIAKLDLFVTINPRMLERKEELEKRFKLKIADLGDMKEMFDPAEISRCPHCFCMTHTLYGKNLCGKCKKPKEKK